MPNKINLSVQELYNCDDYSYRIKKDIAVLELDITLLQSNKEIVSDKYRICEDEIIAGQLEVQLDLIQHKLDKKIKRKKELERQLIDRKIVFESDELDATDQTSDTKEIPNPKIYKKLNKILDIFRKSSHEDSSNTRSQAWAEITLEEIYDDPREIVGREDSYKVIAKQFSEGNGCVGDYRTLGEYVRQHVMESKNN